MTVAEAQQRVDAVEFVQWQQYFTHEPFGDEWLRTAMLCVMLSASRGVRATVDEFLPVARPRWREQSPREMESVLTTWALVGGQRR